MFEEFLKIEISSKTKKKQQINVKKQAKN